MKLFKFMSLVLLTCFCNASFALDHGKLFQQCEKHYISSSQVSIDQQGIFVHLEDQIIKTASLQHDQGGVFIDNYVPVDSDWLCPGCHRWWPDEIQSCKTPGCIYSSR